MSPRGGNRNSRVGWVFQVLLVVMAASLYLPAQVQLGDNLNLHLGGALGYGYSGFTGTGLPSAHGQGFSGSGQLSGYYFDQRFINFDVKPYYNRSQSSATTATIDRGTGFTSTAEFFSATAFPGTIAYGDQFDSSSIMTIAGIPSIASSARGRQFTATWAELIKGLPPVNFTFSKANGSANVPGVSSNSNSSSMTFGATTYYVLKGFNLNGNYQHQSSSFETPQILLPEITRSSGSGSSYGVSASHAMPLHGSFGLGFAHFSSGSNDDSSSTGNSYNGSVSVTPFSRLSLSSNAIYYTNANAYFLQSIGADGLVLRNVEHDNSALSLLGTASLRVGHGITVVGTATRRTQYFADREQVTTQYNGTLAYRKQSKAFGFLYFGVGFIDSANKEGNIGNGLTGNVGMQKRFKGWETGADFGYTQYLQTMGYGGLISNLSYGANARRKISNDMFFSAAWRASSTGPSLNQSGSSSSQSFSAAFTKKSLSLGSNYSESKGQAILSTSGTLIPIDGQPLFTSDAVYFNARSFGVSATKTWHRLWLSGTYNDIQSDTRHDPVFASVSGKRFLISSQYHLRGLAFGGGFSRSMQDVSTIVGGPRVINSYYFSVTRWFNVF